METQSTKNAAFHGLWLFFLHGRCMLHWYTIFANRKTCGKYTTEGIIPHCYIYSSYCTTDTIGSNFKIGVLRLIPPIYRDISIRVVVSAAWVCLTIGARWQSNKNRFLIPHQSRFGLSGSRSPQSLKNLHSDRISYKSCKDMVLGLPFLIFSTIRLHPFSRLVFANTANHCCVDFYIYPYICPWRSPRDTFFLGQRRSGPVYFSMYSMIIANAT